MKHRRKFLYGDERLLIPIILLLGILPGRATAQIDPGLDCRMYFASDNGATRESVAKLMIERKDPAARACFRSDGRLESYSSFSESLRRTAEVCIFIESPVVPPPRPGQVLITHMAVSADSCPQQSVETYAIVAGVSEGLFLKILNFVDRLSSSGADFDRSLQMRDRESEFSISLLSEIRQALLAERGHGRDLVRAIFGPYLDPVFTEERQGYCVHLSTQGDRLKQWLLYVDFVGDELRVTGLSLTIE